MSEKIRILVADDHAVVREGLIALINTERDMIVIGEAADGIEAVARVKELRPDLILMDLMMPHMDGIQAIQEIKKVNPHARILVLTSFAEDRMLFPAIKAGAQGYLLKDSSPHDLIQAVRDVYLGQSSLHPAVARKLVGELQRPPQLPPTEDPLTEREAEILNLVAQGFSNQEIADQLVLSERTVRTHVTNILGKLHLANRTQAALYAIRKGMIDLGPNGSGR